MFGIKGMKRMATSYKKVIAHKKVHDDKQSRAGLVHDRIV